MQTLLALHMAKARNERLHGEVCFRLFYKDGVLQGYRRITDASEKCE